MQEKKILVVEDNEFNQQLICEYVKNMGYSVNAVVDNYSEAISSVESNRPDLVLMDILLKGNKDGISISKKIRERFDIPIIYVTSYADDDILERAKNTNPNGYIIKPFKYKELKASIDLALSNYSLSKTRESLSFEYEKAFANLRCGIITTDNDGRVLFMNKIAEMFTGFQLEDAKNCMLSDVLLFSYNRLTDQLLNEVKRKGSVYHDEDYFIIINRNGNSIKIKIKIGTQYINDSSFITFFIWENTVNNPAAIYEIDKSKQFKLYNDTEIQLMIVSKNAIARDGIWKALSHIDNINVVCMAYKKIELIDCLNNNIVDIVVINDDHPDTNGIFQIVYFIKNIDSNLKIVVTSERLDDQKERKLLLLGVKGLINTSEVGYDIAYTIYLVFKGDLWFRRCILNNYVNSSLKAAQAASLSINYLTPREKQIYYHITNGKSNKEISQLLNIDEKTVKNHINNINRKLGINIRSELIN